MNLFITIDREIRLVPLQVALIKKYIPAITDIYIVEGPRFEYKQEIADKLQVKQLFCPREELNINYLPQSSAKKHILYIQDWIMANYPKGIIFHSDIFPKTNIFFADILKNQSIKYPVGQSVVLYDFSSVSEQDRFTADKRPIEFTKDHVCRGKQELKREYFITDLDNQAVKYESIDNKFIHIGGIRFQGLTSAGIANKWIEFLRDKCNFHDEIDYVWFDPSKFNAYDLKAQVPWQMVTEEEEIDLRQDPISLAKRYAEERKVWMKYGSKLRSTERIAEIFDTKCLPCNWFQAKKHSKGKGICGKCGCMLKRKGIYLNKIAWATTKCPLKNPKWTSEVKTKKKK